MIIQSRKILNLINFEKSASEVFYTFIILLVIEFLAIFLVPNICPDHVYLRAYLSKNAIESFRKFSNDKSEFLIYDPVVGWRNRPNSSKEEWEIDAYGARTTNRFNDSKLKTNRVLFLGNSLTNGGIEITNNETISAYIEDSITESINFATMLYSIDQSFLLYKYYLKKINPNVIVVGLSGTPTLGLTNQYIPFRFPKEKFMPFIKPRFKINSGELELIHIPSISIFKNILDNSDLLNSLSKSDGYYKNFKIYKSFGFTPLAAFGMKLNELFNRIIRISNKKTENLDLFILIMQKLKKEVESNGSILIFMMLPDGQTTFKTGLRKYIPDKYEILVNSLKEFNFKVFDARETLRVSNVPLSRLYSEDEGHYSPEGNKIIASGLKEIINESIICQQLEKMIIYQE